MNKNTKFFARNVICALIFAIIGLLFIWKGNIFLQNIGTVILVSGIYTIIDNMFIKSSLIDLINQKVSIKREIVETGLDKIDYVLSNINYIDYLNEAKNNIDIIHNYARTWTNTNYDFVRRTVLNNNCLVRVILLNPNSLFIRPLEEHYNYKMGELNDIIKEISKQWYKLYCDIEKKKNNKEKSTYKNRKCGKLELYYFNGQPTNSLYRIDDRIIVVYAKNSKTRSAYLPYCIFENNGEKSLYNWYLDEIENIIKEATKVEFEKEGFDGN